MARFVLVGAGDGAPLIGVSSDGIEWGEVTVPASVWSNNANGAFAVTHTGSQWITAGDDGIIATSPDAIVWTRRTNANSSTRDFVSLAYGNGLIVATGAIGTAQVSSDGEHWASIVTSKTHLLRNVGYGRGLFLISEPGSGKGIAIWSGDIGQAIRWSHISTNVNVYQIAYGAGVFAAIGRNYNYDYAMLVSSDAENWTITATVDMAALGEPGGIEYCDSQFVAIVCDDYNSKTMTSPDGFSWAEHHSPGSGHEIRSLAYRNGIGVCAKYDGDGLFYTQNGYDWSPVIDAPSAVYFYDVAAAAAEEVASTDIYRDPVPSSLGRGFFIGTSDYSDRVISWPRIRKTSRELKSVTIDVPLDNTDGHFNRFHENRYTMPNTCVLRLGLADQTITLYTGFLKDVKYSKQRCTLKLKDRLFSLAERKVGDSDVPVEFTHRRPSEIAWTLCTCYGGMSAIANSSNPDINYARWAAWHAAMVADNVLCGARYGGTKIFEALDRIGEMTDTGIWVDEYGKINFLRYTSGSSLDETLDWDDWIDLELDVEGLMLINRQSIGLLYDPSSKYWASTITVQDGPSINSFGAREDLLADETIWYQNSVSALTVATQRLMRRYLPPERYTVDTALIGVRRTIGETLRMVDSFYGVTSATGWRVVDQDINLENGAVRYEVEGELTLNAFTLDVSALDGSDRLL